MGGGAKPPAASTSCLARGQHGHCQASALEGTDRGVRRMLCDGAAGSSRCVLVQRSALSWLPLWCSLCCSLSAEAELCPYPPTACCSSTEVQDEEPHGMALPRPCHGAGQRVHWAASRAGSQILLHACHPFPPLPSPASLLLTLSCLSLYPFLNYCLHCALKMQCTVKMLSVFIIIIIISPFSLASLTLSSLAVVASRENVWAYIIYSCVRVITEMI